MLLTGMTRARASVFLPCSSCLLPRLSFTALPSGFLTCTTLCVYAEGLSSGDISAEEGVSADGGTKTSSGGFKGRRTVTVCPATFRTLTSRSSVGVVIDFLIVTCSARVGALLMVNIGGQDMVNELFGVLGRKI